MSDSLNILVIGECGDGKSQLVKFFADRAGVRDGPIPGLAANGQTKDLKKYDVGVIRGRHVTLIDTPGVGDKDIKLGQLIVMIETFLESDHINGVIICSQVARMRITLGGQMVGTVAEKGFQGDDKWKGFIIVGTQKDRCKKRELENFKNDVVPKFNGFIHGDIDKIAFTALDPDEAPDVAELLDMIEKLPGFHIEYEKPNAKDLGAALQENMGIEIPPEVIEKEIVVSRNAVGDFFKNLGKGASVVATAGLMGWDGDSPTFGAWNSRNW